MEEYFSDEERQMARDMQMGSEQDFILAVRRLKAGSGVADVSNRVSFEREFERFAEANPGIVSDPILSAAALQLDRQLIEAGDRRSYRERYDQIAEYLNDWLGRHDLHPASDESEIDRAQVIESMRRSRANGRSVDEME